MRFLPRRLRSFSLRTLLVLVGMLCLALGWVASERHAALRRKKVRASLDSFLTFAVEPVQSSFTFRDHPRKSPAHVSWLRRYFGDEPVQQFVAPYECKPWHLAMAAHEFPEANEVVWYAWLCGKMPSEVVPPPWFESLSQTEANFLPADSYVPLENARSPRAVKRHVLASKRPPPAQTPPATHHVPYPAIPPIVRRQRS